MIWQTVEFIWHETSLQLRRERLIAIATVSTVAVLLVLVGALLLLLLDLRMWPDVLAKQVTVTAFFDKTFDRAKAEQEARDVAAWPEVAEAKFVPREEAWEQFKSSRDPGVTAGFTASVLPDAMRVRVHAPEQVPAVAEKLRSVEGVEDISDPVLSFAHAVVKFQQAVVWISLVVVCLVALAGVMIVHNTIRLALHSRWREIYIMQLVGATRPLIAAPFMLEGTAHGMLGAALAACLLVPAHMYLRTVVARNWPLFGLQPDAEIFRFGGALLLGGALLGLTGSAISVRRFLARRPEWHV